jgi:hypothetical protein
MTSIFAIFVALMLKAGIISADSRLAQGDYAGYEIKTTEDGKVMVIDSADNGGTVIIFG